VRGLQGEAEIPYAGLLALLQPLLGLVGQLPPVQGAALRSALALGPPSPQDRFAVPVALLGLLGLLGLAAEERPVLVLVDGAHWLDSASREALLFVARRLRTEGVGVLMAVREGDPASAFDVAGLEEARLAGIDTHAARALLGGVVVPAVADQLVAANGGNPLWLLELPRVLTEDERRGVRPLPRPLPTGDKVEELREALEEALRTFDQVGARAWSDRARAAVRGTGGRDRTATGAAPSSLTAQEFRVAELVASGMTNREAGAGLFLSPKTIEHHLSAIYKKLRARTRRRRGRVVRPRSLRGRRRRAGEPREELVLPVAQRADLVAQPLQRAQQLVVRGRAGGAPAGRSGRGHRGRSGRQDVAGQPHQLGVGDGERAGETLQHVGGRRADAAGFELVKVPGRDPASGSGRGQREPALGARRGDADAEVGGGSLV